MQFKSPKQPENLNGESLWISLINHLSDFIICLSSEGRILAINKPFEDFFKLRSEKLIGKKFREIFENLNIDFLMANNLKNLSAQLPLHQLECVYKDHQGKNRSISWTLKNLPTLDNDQDGFMLMGKDVTELRTLSLQVERLDNIIKYAPDWIYWKDRNSVHLGCNDQFAKAAGFKTREEMIGKSDFDCPWRENAPKYKQDDKEVIESGLPKLNIEDTVPLQHGKKAIVISNKVPLRDTQTGQVIGILGIATVITELKEMQVELIQKKESAEAANISKSNFLATMSHELRTPMNAIINMSQALFDDPTLTAKQHETVGLVSEAADNLLGLINDILDFAKLEAGKLKLEKTSFNIKETAKKAATNLKNLAEGSGLELIFIADDLPEFVMGDPHRVRQIIINLLGNAIKFTKKGHVKLSLKLKKSTKKTAHIEIIVEDTGIGIAKENLDTIFNKFTQVESKYNRRFGGTGLGLAITKDLVNVMNGTIEVQSTVGKGSLFCIDIPFPLAPKASAVTPSKVQEKIETTSKLDLDLLIIEDNPLNRKVIEMMLEGTGCHLEMAEDGRVGLDKYRQKEYDLILTDIGLPDIDGIEVIKTIRKGEEKEKKHIPIIAITAHVLPEDVNNCLQAGADAVIPKPIKLDELKKILKKLSHKKL